MVLVKTGNVIERDNIRYDVVIADDNIFVICKHRYKQGKETHITSYLKPEIYANQSDINTLDDLHMQIVG